MPRTYEGARVVKRLAATQPGAIKLARRYGGALVCVRYRHDPDGRHRYTTVELVVEKVLIVRRKIEVVAVRLGTDETTLHAQARAHGAKWDSRARLWYMSRSAARKLGLLNRIAQG
jgi:hypothetical protein